MGDVFIDHEHHKYIGTGNCGARFTLGFDELESLARHAMVKLGYVGVLEIELPAQGTEEHYRMCLALVNEEFDKSRKGAN